MTIPIWQYYKGLGKLRKVATGPFFISPLLSLVIPSSIPLSEYLYPPLGDFQLVWLAATMGFLLLTTFWVFGYCQSVRKVRTRTYVLLTIAFLVGVMGSIAIYQPYVLRVRVVDQDVPVSVGFEPKNFANLKYPQKTADEMLEKRGPWEPEIKKLWTARSIVAVRIGLWFSYTLALASMLAIASFIAYDSEQNKP